MTKSQTQNLWDISILPFCNFSKNEKAPSGPGPTGGRAGWVGPVGPGGSGGSGRVGPFRVAPGDPKVLFLLSFVSSFLVSFSGTLFSPKMV